MTGKTLKTGKYYDRDQFTYDEKVAVCRKTNDECSHCGKKIFIGYGATVDHFIPLNKGGSNRMINLVPLCKECNDAKEDKLYSIDYVPYLKEKYKQELAGYVESYVNVMDYVQRHRLLAYDEYEDHVLITPTTTRKTRKKSLNGIKSNFKIKLATWNDLDRIHEYLVRYLRKNNCLDSEKAARDNVIFWMRFGCIYYIERNNEISVMIAVTIKQMDSQTEFSVFNQPFMYIFPYYTTDITYNIVKNTIIKFAYTILEENNLLFIPINVVFLREEPLQHSIAYKFNAKMVPDEINGFNVFGFVIGDNVYEIGTKNKDEYTTEEKYTYTFFEKFNDVTSQLIQYFSKYGDKEHIGWMISTILSRETIQSTELHKYVSYNNEEG